MTRKDYERAAAIVRAMADSVDPESVRPIPNVFAVGDMGRDRCEGLAVWNAREAFVSLFAENPRFDADYFRAACVPLHARKVAKRGAK